MKESCSYSSKLVWVSDIFCFSELAEPTKLICQFTMGIRICGDTATGYLFLNFQISQITEYSLPHIPTSINCQTWTIFKICKVQFSRLATLANTELIDDKASKHTNNIHMQKKSINRNLNFLYKIRPLNLSNWKQFSWRIFNQKEERDSIIYAFPLRNQDRLAIT